MGKLTTVVINYSGIDNTFLVLSIPKTRVMICIFWNRQHRHGVNYPSKYGKLAFNTLSVLSDKDTNKIKLTLEFSQIGVG